MLARTYSAESTKLKLNKIGKFFISTYESNLALGISGANYPPHKIACMRGKLLRVCRKFC